MKLLTFIFLELLTHNTTSGTFRKLGRLYGSCLRQTMNSSTIRLTLDELGGYLPIGAVGPSSIAPLVSKINKLGPTPLLGIYYDLSYGKQIMLIIDGPMEFAPVLENPIRWKRPKAPPYRIRNELPVMLDNILNNFLPSGLGSDQMNYEKSSIINFIKELNNVILHIFSNFLKSFFKFLINYLNMVW